MSDNRIVGHKTFDDGTGGFRHEPLYEDEAQALMASIDAATKSRAELMPDEQAAVRMLTDAHQRLKELGWREAIYCPKDGAPFLAIEPGSSGFHTCSYQGDWPNGHWWVEDAGDVWPSHPCLFKPIAGEKEKTDAPYGERCRDPALCKGKSSCPKDPTCGD
jgi:hypothetical protein